MSTNSAIRFARLAALIAAASLSMAFTEPGAAARTDPRSPDQGSSSAAPAASQDPNQEICVRDTRTGSRLSRRICRTRLQWEAEGGVPTER
jgi:hypothetical protein